MPRRLAIVAACILFAWAAFHAISLRMSESLYSDRNSIAYWVTTKALIRDVPLVGPVKEPRFYSSAGDGPKLSESAISYASSESAERIVEATESYLIGRGYSRRADGAYVLGNSVVSIEIDAPASAAAARLVTVRENR